MIKFKSLIILTLYFLGFTSHVLQGQSHTYLPPIKYQTKYYFRHFDYPLKGIDITKLSKSSNKATPLTTHLNKHFVLLGVKEEVAFQKTYPHNAYSPFTTYLALTDTLLVYSNWGYDTIRSVAELSPVSPFYMFKTEITNQQWKEFITDITQGHSKKTGLADSFGWNPTALIPDTNVWLSQMNYSEPFVHYYYQHPAYSDYPVVGVSQFQATQFTDWLEQKWNQQYKIFLPKGYRIQVDLPTATEFATAVKYNQTYWGMHFSGLISKKQLKNINIIPRYFVNNEVTENPELISWFSQDGFSLNVTLASLDEINGGEIISERGVNLRSSKLSNPFDRSFVSKQGIFYVTAVESGRFPICNLQGNVEEWTSTRAKGHLFDAKQWMYTRQGRLILNPDIHVSESELEGLLHTDKELNTHFAVKGGSWSDEFHYLDPWAVKMQRGDYKSANLGFRIVVRIVSEM